MTKLNLAHSEHFSLLFKSFEYIYGNNSGLQALSISHLFLPQNIILIGFDFTAKEDQTHGYKKSDNKSSEHYSKFWKMFLKDFQKFEKLRQQKWRLAHTQVDLPKIWNVNSNSALKLYDQSKTLIDFL